MRRASNPRVPSGNPSDPLVIRRPVRLTQDEPKPAPFTTRTLYRATKLMLNVERDISLPKWSELESGSKRFLNWFVTYRHHSRRVKINRMDMVRDWTDTRTTDSVDPFIRDLIRSTTWSGDSLQFIELFDKLILAVK